MYISIKHEEENDKMKIKLSKIKLNVLEKAVRIEVKKIDNWPPICTGILHQPVRPKTNHFKVGMNDRKDSK